MMNQSPTCRPLPAWLRGARASRPLKVLLAAGALLWAVTAWCSGLNKSAAVDEVPHIGAGLAILARGDFRMNPEHPPLVKVLAALPVYLFARPDLKVHFGDGKILGSWLDSSQNEYGYHLLFRGGQEPRRILAYARIVPVLIGLLGGVFAYLWGRELSGHAAGGALSAFLLLTYPEYTGHGRLLTFDVPTLVACAAVAWFGLRWWRRPDWRRTLAVAAVVAIGSQVKLPVTVFSGFLVVTLALLSLGRPAGRRMRHLGRVCLLSLALAAGYVAASWTGAGFRFTHYDPKDPPEEMTSYVKPDPAPAGVKAHLINAALRYRLLPETAVASINHAGSFEGRLMYLFGGLSRKGWYYYFLVTILTKTPLLMLAGFAAAGGAALWRVPRLCRTRAGRWRLERALLLGLPFALLFALYCWSRPNIGHRQILFVYFPLCVLLGVAASRLLERCGSSGRLIVGGLVTAQLLIFAMAWPHYETWFNEMIRTPYRGSRYVMDSNIDWGTDLPLAMKTLRELEIDEVNYAAFGLNRPESYGLEKYRWLLPRYPFSLYMPEAKPPDPRLPSLISLHTLPDVRYLYPDFYSRPPDLLLNSFVLFRPLAAEPVTRPAAPRPASPSGRQEFSQ